MQMLEICDKLDGNYNVTTAALIRRDGYEFSRANNPQLLYDAPRFMTSGGEAMFPIGMMQDGRAIARGDPLTCRSLLPFYKDSRYPDDFWRREGGFGFTPVFAGVGQMRAINTVNGVHVIEGGHAEGLGNFIKTPPDLQTMLDTNGVCCSLRCECFPVDLNFHLQPCALYRWTCRRLTEVLYPNATGVLLEAIKGNYANLYPAMMFRGAQPACPQLFPYEQPCPKWDNYF